uniref:F-box domain-containing protein n=1 Tax=Triticum aestivum TaxID=4565 RepID=A0A3B6EPB6_WHEAT
MADATSAGATPLLPGLPDDIVVWDILVRLDPKSLLRCRAVHPSWRRTTSTRDFLLTHHARQPTLLVASGQDYGSSEYDRDIIVFDHPATADAQLQHFTQLDESNCSVVASCDGLLLLSYDTEGACFSICNPATRQCAPLPVLCDFMMPLGMYRHHPTGEYRILLYDKNEEEIEDENKEIYVRDGGCCIFELGSVQPSRNIGCLPEAEQVLSRCGHGAVILLHGNMHWYLEQRENGSDMVLVFDTTTESFQHMQAPVVQVAPGFPLYNDLFDMDGMLGMFSCNDDASIIDIWVLKDYENMVWTFKCKIELPVTEMKLLCGGHDDSLYPVVIHGDGE